MKKLWGVRHIRWFWLRWRLALWVSQCASMGIGFVESQADIDYLAAIWRGEV